MVNRGLQHLALGREPEAIIDKLGIFRHQLILKMRCAAVEVDTFNTAMGTGINLAAGRFIHAA